MITFEYTARDKDSRKVVKSEVQAQSEQAAARLLVEQNLIPLSIKNVDQKRGVLGKFGGHVKTKDRILYTRQLATLINAGLPLTQALHTVGEQIPNDRLKTINSEIISDIEGGSRLSDAFAKHTKVFNEIYIQLVAAGEASGTLDESLERIASQQEKDAAVLSKIRGAMVYPLIVIIVISMVMIFMLTTVVPQIKTLYEDLGRDLPFVTQMLVTVSDFITNFWYVIIGMIVGLVYFLRSYAHTESGGFLIDKVKMRAPLFGKLFVKLYMARFSRTGATLLKAGVPILEMLKITANSINNVHVEASINQAATKVKGGKALSVSLENDPNFLPLVSQMIGIGEKSGAIEEMMSKTATYYEDELDNQIKAISTIIEPALMVILAVMAGTIIGAILLPVYGLVGQSVTI